MSFKSFIPKIPIAVGVVTGGMTFLAVVFFLAAGFFGNAGKQAEFYQQQPEPNIPLYIDGAKTIALGVKTPLNIVINPMGQQVLGAEVKLRIKYNPIAIDTQGRQDDSNQLWNIDFGQTAVPGWNYVIKKIEGDLITISAAASSPDQAIKTTASLATLNFSLNQPGNVIFEFSQDDSNYGSTKETSVVISKDSLVSNLISEKLPTFAMEVMAPQINSCSGVDLSRNQIEVLENSNATEKQVIDPKNQIIVFKLETNPSTGYSWAFDYDKNVFELLCQDFIQTAYDCPPGADCRPPVGSGGQSLTYFKINNFIGKATIAASYGRSWENQSPLKVVKVDFVLVPSIPKPSIMPSPIASVMPSPVSSQAPQIYKLDTMPSAQILIAKPHGVNEGYGIYVLLKDRNGVVIADQRNYTYSWSVDDPSIIELKPWAPETCQSEGTQPPCPLNHATFRALKTTPQTGIKVEVYEKGPWFEGLAATAKFSVAVGDKKVTINVTGLGSSENLPFTLYGLPLVMTMQEYLPQSFKPEFIASGIYTTSGTTMLIDLEKIPTICKQNQGCQVVIKTDRHLSATAGVHNFIAEKTLEFKITPQQELVIGDLYPAYTAEKLGQDDIINAFDMAYLLTQWEKPGKADLNNDGKVNVFDLKILIGNVGKKGLLYGGIFDKQSPIPQTSPSDGHVTL